jgi:ribosome-associated toxin RatA of RatAB toxin-antitoxin module
MATHDNERTVAMRHVDIAVSAPGTDPGEAFKSLSDYERYPELTDAVLGVTVTKGEGGRERCTWEVKFRRGILIWTEDGIADPERRRIEFSLVDGDLDALEGYWQVEELPDGSLIRFACSFDMGIPTLAHLLEPIAADTLRENVANMCEGLFGTTEVLDSPAEAPR